MRKGFVQIVPVVVIAVLLLGGFFVVSSSNVQNQKNAVGKVLSDRDGGGGGEDHGGSSGGSNSGGSSQSSNNSQPSGGGESKPKESERPKAERPEIKKVEFKNPETKTEIRNLEFTSKANGAETEVRKNETKIEIGGFHLEVKNEDGRIVTKVESENEGSGAAKEVEDEVEKEVERKLDDKDIHFASGSAELGFVEKGRRVRTNFPLSVNPQSGELSVTTPAGTKVVAVLPSVAIDNLIRAGVLTTTTGGTGGAGTGTASAALGNPAIELTSVNNQPAFVIDGFKVKKLLGLVPVNISKQTVVSVESGQLLDVREGVLSRALDVISF